MSFAQDEGYIPVEFDDLMSEIRVNINTQFSLSYTEDSFLGTNWYKFAYAIAQKIQQGEVKVSEIFTKLQEYIATTNEDIQRPTVSYPGLVESFSDNDYIASIKPPLEADAGKIYVCVDVDNTDPDYATVKLAINTLIKDFVAAGVVSQGTESSTIVLSNGQSFDFKFNLPSLIPVTLRLTASISENNLIVVPSDEDIRTLVFDNINSRYQLGYNFEPQKYFSILTDAAWAASALLEWSNDSGANWHSTVYDADYDELFDFDLEDISVVIS